MHGHTYAHKEFITGLAWIWILTGRVQQTGREAGVMQSIRTEGGRCHAKACIPFRYEILINYSLIYSLKGFIEGSLEDFIEESFLRSKWLPLSRFEQVHKSILSLTSHQC